MPIIYLETTIFAPRARVFDLARCIDLHETSMTTHRETAVAGVTTGLIGLKQSVTWRAKHFGVWQHLTSTITSYDRPRHFRDSMVKGAFKRFDHDHYFEEHGSYTRMIDVFDYDSPFGVLGYIADAFVLKRYMERLLAERNRVVKMIAETDRWQAFLSAKQDTIAS